MTEIKNAISISDFLSLPKGKRPRVLKEHGFALLIEDAEFALTVRQLTKAEHDSLSKRINALRPPVPLVDQVYTIAHRDPAAPVKIRPAGTYKEPSDKDPAYLSSVEDWFTAACIWMGIYSAHESLQIDLSDPDAIDAKYEEIIGSLPPSCLYDLALQSAFVNPGLTIAEELRAQETRRIELEKAQEEFTRLQAEYEAELSNSAQAAPDTQDAQAAPAAPLADLPADTTELAIPVEPPASE